MIKPISPDEVVSKKLGSIPEEVIDAFNEAIVMSWDGKVSTFTQDYIIAKICEKNSEISREHIFACRWLDVELIYENCGWNITYDKPGYNETYPATFTFKKVVKHGIG